MNNWLLNDGTHSRMEQLANVGSDVAWGGKDQHRCEQAFDRAVKLLDLPIADERWKRCLKELTGAREVLCNAMFGRTTYGSDLASLDHYFCHFAMATRAGR